MHEASELRGKKFRRNLCGWVHWAFGKFVMVKIFVTDGLMDEARTCVVKRDLRDN